MFQVPGHSTRKVKRLSSYPTPANYDSGINDRMMETLFTEDDYREALKRFMEICDAPEDTPEAIELKKLMYWMQIYEQDNCS